MDTEIIQEASSFQGRIDIAGLYHSMCGSIQRLHESNQDARARELYFNVLHQFASVWDETFLHQMDKINKVASDDPVLRYRMGVAELSMLMQRVGITGRSDVKVSPDKAAWDAPASLSDMVVE